MNDIKFEITAHLGVLTEYPSGWKKELNIVKWGDRQPVFDIRDWDETRVVPGGVVQICPACVNRAARHGVLSYRTRVDVPRKSNSCPKT